MLSQRQIEILLEYCNHTGEYYTASRFAELFDVSLRTIQNDMKVIRDELQDESCMELVAKTAKGSTIIIKDKDEFSAYVNALYQEMAVTSLNYPASRISQLLLRLLNTHHALNFSSLEEEFYVSRSTLLNDLKRVEEIMAQYHLSLLKNSNCVMVDGKEINMRRCLKDQDLYLVNVENNQGVRYVDERQISKIKNVLTEVFVDHKYHITDADFNNLVLFLNIMILRMNDGFYIQESELREMKSEGSNYELSKAVFEKIKHRFFLRVPESEIQYFCIYLQALGNNRDEGTITPEVDEFILESLKAIEERFGYDFMDNLNLRITLAIHTMSLIVRLQYDMQAKCEILDYMRGSFPLGYEIGMYFGHLLTQKYGKKVNDDEVALLAVHFYSSLMEANRNKEKAKVMVFTDMKMSLTVLLRQTLLRWFSDDVSHIEFECEDNFDLDHLDDYDIFLTTEPGEMYRNNLAMLINPFPTQKDYFNIKLNIDGFKSIDDVIAMFHPELFKTEKQIGKKEALQYLCQKSEEYFGMEGLMEQIFKREEIGSTFLTKQIAVAHPAEPVSSDTFLSVMVVKKPIAWDVDGNMVNLILLMHIGKNNPNAFNLWNYVAKICRDKELVNQSLANPDFETFISLVSKAIEMNIDEN